MNKHKQAAVSGEPSQELQWFALQVFAVQPEAESPNYLLDQEKRDAPALIWTKAHFRGGDFVDTSKSIGLLTVSRFKCILSRP